MLNDLAHQQVVLQLVMEICIHQLKDTDMHDKWLNEYSMQVKDLIQLMIKKILI
jgi:hypothetical protein